jgi:hypothetical protein
MMKGAMTVDFVKLKERTAQLAEVLDRTNK